jgi:hypothetical protein
MDARHGFCSGVGMRTKLATLAWLGCLSTAAFAHAQASSPHAHSTMPEAKPDFTTAPAYEAAPPSTTDTAGDLPPVSAPTAAAAPGATAAAAPPASLPTAGAPPTSAARAPDSQRSSLTAAGWLRSKPHEHDGFYARFGLGFAGFTDGLVADPGRDSARDAGANTGVGTASELAIGGVVARGLVLGGGFFGSSALVTDYHREDGSGVPSALRNPGSFLLLGPFADWYFAPKVGLHAQAALGLATLTGWRWEQALRSERSVAAGGGVMLGIGKEWWISDDWGLGVMARLTAGALAERHDGRYWYHATATFPSVLLTATYN